MLKRNNIFDANVVIGILSKSSLPTVIIEGNDDVIVYRRMEDIFHDVGLSVMPVGGRNNVLQVFERLHEITTPKNIAFIADLDTWVMSKVPPQYISDLLLFTDGYSIENDIFRDGDLEKILSKDEKARFKDDLSRFVTWYAIALNRLNENEDDTKINMFPGTILDNIETFKESTLLRAGENFPTDLHNIIISDYPKFLRGKSLMQILSRQLAHKDRGHKLHTLSLLDIASASPGPLLNQTHKRIGKIFGGAAAFG
jgi:hypothetical protein